MGKKQHQKDKLYMTMNEWKYEGGGKKDLENFKFIRMPFYHCFISMLPFKDPYCSREGAIFDITNIVPFLKKYNVNPVTGEKMSVKDLVKLNFHKNSDGFFHCPILFKQFTDNTHIVAIATSGNVYSYEAIRELNLKVNYMKDLMDSNILFTKSDIIHLQDPNQLDRFNPINFYHVKRNLKIDADTSVSSIKKVNAETESIIKELNQVYDSSKFAIIAPTDSSKLEKNDTENSATNEKIYAKDSKISTGAVAYGFTNTALTPATKQTLIPLNKDKVRYSRVKTKAFVQITTNFGNLNFELYAHLVPKTCENFILLAKTGYYNGTFFHRLIPGFVIQGGDPNGNGSGGQSAWKEPFEDEFHPSLRHASRGMLSMANSGKNTNKSQFFITFAECNHLNNKNTVFGKMVGGFETLKTIETVKVGNDYFPTQTVSIININVFKDPFEAADKELKEEYDQTAKQDDEKNQQKKVYKRNSSAKNQSNTSVSTVGMYLPKMPKI